MTADRTSPPHFHVVDGFSPLAAPARRRLVEHFAEPDRQSPASHGVWNYWHVPGLYTYLRAEPRRLLDARLVDRFLAELRHWSLYTLGCSEVSPPCLSLYVNGCRQNLHNDAANGRWAYVWSLTAPSRPFIGGSTVLFRPDPYWGTAATDRPVAGEGLYDLVAPEFNRLVVFDDRLIHGVEPVEGGMAPLDGRLVLHGHLREGEPWASGGLAGESRAVHAELGRLAGRLAAALSGHHGLLCLRLSVTPAGTVSGVDVLTERLLLHAGPVFPSEELSALVVRAARRAVFPAAPEPSVIVAPVRIRPEVRRAGR
ncbi:hypothetical protein PL81_34100 [Streptomyces sp. RSD-27]|nr:hypothetical protein PL81_34100 [Streptomyces sp. RSD-27]